MIARGSREANADEAGRRGLDEKATARLCRAPFMGGSLSAMVHRVVLTAIGDDRPGLVDEVARFIAERGGNLEDSRMLNLHGQFAMMLLVAGDEHVVERLGADLGRLMSETRVHAQLTAADRGGGVTDAVPYRLTTSAMDHPGLVQSVAHVLHEIGVNIESVETTLRPAPVTGAPLFEMEMVLAVPASTRVAELRRRLGDECDELNLDWQLSAL
jgi:glycine cleavage system transcriptional repressor